MPNTYAPRYEGGIGGVVEEALVDAIVEKIEESGGGFGYVRAKFIRDAVEERLDDEVAVQRLGQGFTWIREGNSDEIDARIYSAPGGSAVWYVELADEEVNPP